MATAFINKMLECPICFEQFRQPKALPCQHTFCLEPCLKDLVNSEKTSIECPICRKIHDLPNGGVEKFPNNFTILELLEESRKIFHGSPRSEVRSRHSSPVPTAPSIEDIGQSLYPSIDMESIEVATEAIEIDVPSTKLDDKIGTKPKKKSIRGKLFSSFKKKLKGDSNENSSGGGTDPKLVNEKKASMFSKIFHGSNAGLSEEEVKATLENVADCFSIKMQYEFIHLAAELNMTKELKFLLHNDSPVDSLDKYGFTPLHRAANQGSIDAVKFLLKNKADINATNCYGATAFHYAAMGLKIDVMKYLVKKGANVQTIDNCGWNAYDYAESFNRFDKEIFGFLLDLKLRETKFEDVQNNYIYGKTKYFNPKHLLSCRQTIDVRGWTPLHYASRFSDQDTVEFLLQKGFRCDAQTISRYNCLHLAACNKNIGVIKLIWDNFGTGADKNAKDFKGFAPIHLASAKGLVSTVKFLLDQSDTIEKQPLNQDHSNPLHEAVMFKQKEVVKILLKNGLDKNLKNKKGETPIMIAKNIVSQTNGWEMINDQEILQMLSPRIKRRIKIKALKASRWLFGPSSSQNTSIGSGDGTTNANNFIPVNHNVNETTGAMSQAMNALHKRGENLSRLENLTANIDSQAQTFAKNAELLRKKNEKLYG